ncbi:DinB family protein [Solicola gregarius]|uniref:DinB family protein n=2 Tax=Solicola gregarius TaxID=2908642 RepID=A0AA46TMI7_9ACTN|nr:DUF664 domain-containing protein [Solicola gregarius]UYM07805.1 DinB family protein [Solicola gregarius]
MTSTATNLLGLIKHLAGEEYGYLGELFGRPASARPSWFRDDPATEIDMRATPESRAVTSSRCTGRRQPTPMRRFACSIWRVRGRSHIGTRTGMLGSMLVLMVGETAQHAGHADIVRELIDGVVGTPNLDGGSGRFTEVQAAADRFR